MIRIKQKDGYITVFNSYEVSKDEFMDVISTFDRDKSRELFDKRDEDGMADEWAVHNFAYRIHFMRKHSADVTFEAGISRPLLAFYRIFGKFCRIFIR